MEDPTREDPTNIDGALARVTLAPPEWTGRTPVRKEERGSAQPAAISRRTGAKAEEAALRAALDDARADVSVEDERILCVELARFLASRGRDLDEATSLALRALRMNDGGLTSFDATWSTTSDAELRRELSNWLESLGEAGLAAAVLRPIVESTGEPALAAAVLVRVGVLHARAGDPSGAGEAFEDAARLDPSDVIALELRGTLAAWAPDVVTSSSAAVSYVDAAIRRGASNGDPVEDLLRAFEADPMSSVATSELASILSARGKTGAADEFMRAHGQSFRESDPKRAALVHASRRTQALAAGDVPRALGAAFDERLDEVFEGESASAMNELLLRAGLHELLVARLEAAAERAPREQRGHLYEAIARFCAGALAQPARAAASYVEVVAADPASEEGFAALRAYAASSGDETMLVEALVRVSLARGDDSDAARMVSARALESLAEERSQADLAVFARAQRERIELGHPAASSSDPDPAPSIWVSALVGEDYTALRQLVRERFHPARPVDRKSESRASARVTSVALVNAVLARDAFTCAAMLEQIADATTLQLGSVLLAVAAERFCAIGQDARGRHVAERACQADPTHPRAAATLASTIAATTDRITASALERAISLVGGRGEWCARLADVLEFLGELDYAVAWTQRYVALRPGDRAATEILINRVVRANDGKRLGDTLAWVLSQPQPAAPLSEIVALGLTELAALDRDRAVIVGRRALDVFGPHNPSLRSTILAAADAADDDGLATAVIERWIAAGAKADERKELFVSLADRRAQRGDHEGEARAIVRALRAGADPRPLEDRIIALRSHPLSGDGELAQAESRAICLTASGDTAQAAQSWRNFGAALWDLAGDRRGAVAAWLRAAELAPKRGYFTLGMDIAKFADSRFAVTCLSDLVVKEKDRARAGAIAAEAARAALAIGEPLKAFELASLALERTPEHTDALEIAEHGAVGAGQPKAMSALYDAMGKRALGRYGCRAAHYRGARFFEQHGDPKLALKHAASAFSAVPSEGATLVLLSRTADRADDRAYAVRTIEGVADVARSTGARAAWLLRAAQVAAPGGEGARQRVDILLRASLLAPDLATLFLLGDAARQLMRDLPEESEALAFRVANASRMLTAKVEGPDGARVAIALASLSLELFADNEGALAALSRALGADADLEEYAALIVHAEVLTAAEGITEFLDHAVALIERPYSNVGVGALKLLARIAGARGDSALKGKLTVYAAEREPEDAALVVAADEAVRGLGDTALTARLDKKVPRDERAEILRLFAREQAEDEVALAALERALVLVAPDGREAIERDIRSIYERAGRGDELERRALREAKTADIPTQTRAERFVEVAQIREERQEHAGAAEALLEAARLDPEPLTHWSALERVSELGGLNEFRVVALKAIEARVAPDARPAVLRRLARAHEDVGDAEAATEALEKLLAMAPGDDDADHEIEALIVARGDYAKLVQHLARRADRLSLPPNDDRDSVRALCLRRAAILEQRLGLVAEACSELERLREEWPDNESVLRYLADLYERSGQMDLAGSIWRHLSGLAQGPETQSNLELRAAFALRDARDFPAAFMMVKELLGHGRRDPPVLELWADLARALMDDRELGNALEARAQHTDADAHARAELWVEAAQAAARIGETAISLARAQQAAEVEPGRASTQLFARGLEYRVRGAGALEEAQHTIDQLSGIDGTLDAEDASLRTFLIAEALTVVGAGDTSLTKLTEAYAELGAQPLIALGMAERLISANRFSAAVPFFQAALDGNLLGFRSRGVVALAGADAAVRCDQTSVALRMLDEATLDDDTRITALKRTAHLAASLGDVVRSRAVLMEIARSGNTEDRAVTLAQLGRMLYGSGDTRDHVEAERAFLEAIDAAPVESVLHAQLIAELATLHGRASLYPPISEPPPADATKPSAQSPAYAKGAFGQIREIADFELSVRNAPGKDERIQARRALARAHAERGATQAAEAVLWEALGEGSVEAGDDLAIILEGSDARTSDLLRARQMQADLVPGALRRLEALREAALADHNTAYARAVEHVTRALDPGAGPLPPPPLAAQSHQPGMLAVLTRPSQGPMFEALSLVWEAGQTLFARDPEEYTRPAPGGGAGAEQVLAGGTSRLSRLYEVSTKLLETPKIPLYLQKGTARPAVQLALVAPPSALVVGDVREESPSLRYALGQALSAALPQNVLLMGLPERDGRSMWRAVLGAFGPPGFGRELDLASGRLAESFWQSFPSKTQRRLQELLRDAVVTQYDALVEGARQSSRRTGLFLSGDFNLAVRKVLDELDVLDAPALISELGVEGLCARFGAIADLLRLAASAEYADARWRPLPPASQRGNLLPSGRYKFS